MTGEDLLTRIFKTLGGPQFRDAVGEFDMLDESACERILAIVAGESVEGFGAPKAHGKAVHEDFDEVIFLAAKRWPARFVTRVAADERLRTDTSVLWVLDGIDDPRTATLLVDATRVKAAGHGFTRWAALLGLVRLCHPDLPDLLVTLIKDRDSSPRGVAIEAAIGFGDQRLLPQLAKVTQATRTGRGTRDDAWDAIEAIALRHNLSDVQLGPDSPRLVRVLRPGDAAEVLSVIYTDWPIEVHAGQELATLKVDEQVEKVTAPCGGHVVANLLRKGKSAPEIMFWIRADVPR